MYFYERNFAFSKIQWFFSVKFPVDFLSKFLTLGLFTAKVIFLNNFIRNRWIRLWMFIALQNSIHITLRTPEKINAYQYRIIQELFLLWQTFKISTTADICWKQYIQAPSFIWRHRKNEFASLLSFGILLQCFCALLLIGWYLGHVIFNDIL